jgi:hypothetical protein
MENAERSRTRHRPNTVEPAPRPRLFLFVSLSLNFGLLLFLALVFRRSDSQEVPAPLPDHTTQTSSRTLRTDSKRVTPRTDPTPWQQLESNDLAVYAANLSAAGCPPKTVRDILLPWIEEKFELSEPPTSEPIPFWASFSQRQAAASARAEHESNLGQEKDKMLKELLGFTWTSEGIKEAYAGEAAGPIGFLDYERAEKLLCIADRFKKQLSRANFSRRTDRLSAIYQSWRQEVGEVLSPGEIEETELRGILMTCQRRTPYLCKAGLSGSELRQLMTFRRELCNPLPSAMLAKGDESLQEPDWATEHQLNARTRVLLGESRFVEYLKSSDASIERTIATLEKEHLPRNLALQMFDLREEAMSRAQAIRQLPVRRAEKRSQLAALRQSAVEKLGTDSMLLKISQDWLQEIANP